MKKILAALMLLMPTCLFSTTTMSGNLKNLTGGNISSGSFVRFWLRGCAGNQPRIAGVGIIAPSQGGVFYFDAVPNGSGAISQVLYSTTGSGGTGDGEIECGGSKQAVWYGMQVFNAGKPGPEVPIAAPNSGTVDITSVTPITSTPVVAAPTGDTTYVRSDGGNSPVVGPISFTTRDLVYQVHPADGELAAAVNAKLALCGLSPCVIEIAPGSYTQTGNILIAHDRQNIKCVGGPQGTAITFTPASALAAITIQKAGPAYINQNRIEGCTINGGGSFAKTALDIYSAINPVITDFTVGSGFSGASDVGIHIHGHQFPTILRPAILASTPIQFSADPVGVPDLDFATINTAIFANPIGDTTHCAVTFDSGLTVDNFSIHGASLSNGNGGICWPSGGAATALNTKIENVRCETMAGVTPYCMKIQKRHTGISFDNVESSSGVNGFFLRSLDHLTISNSRVLDGTQVALDLDSTDNLTNHVLLLNDFWNTGATINTVNLSQYAAGPTYNQSGPSWAYYELTGVSDLSFHFGLNTLLDSSTGCHKLGGTTASFSALCADGANAGIFKADKSGYGRLNLGTLSFPSGSGPVVTDTLGAGSKIVTDKMVSTWISATAPTISSGFGTSPSIASNNGTAAFTVNVGTGGTASSGIIGLPTATTGWNCSVNNITASAGHRADNTRQTASSTTSATIENQTKSTGAAVAWIASDIVRVSCFAY